MIHILILCDAPYLPVILLIQLNADLVDEGDPTGAGVGLPRRLPWHPEEGPAFVLQYSQRQLLWRIRLDWRGREENANERVCVRK